MSANVPDQAHILQPPSSRMLWRRLPFLRFGIDPPPPFAAVIESPLFRLPVELRMQIYEYAFSHSSLMPLYIEGRNVRRASTGQPNHRTALLRTCQAICNEAQPVLYEAHDLHLLLLRPSLLEDHAKYPVACSVRRLQYLLTQKIHRLSITVEYGSSVFQQHTSVLLLRWIHLLLRIRKVPLESLTLRLTDDERGHCSRSCAAAMEEVGRRFWWFREEEKVVFAPIESECVSARAWSGRIWLGSTDVKPVGLAAAEEVFQEALRDLWRVPEWWEVYNRLDAWLRQRFGYSLR